MTVLLERVTPRTLPDVPARPDARGARPELVAPSARSSEERIALSDPHPDRDAADRAGAEALIAQWCETRDHGLRNELVVHFSPLVKYVAGRVRSSLPRSIDHADVVSEGMIGLMAALDRFEPERGLAFPTYAVPRIRGAILDAVRASDWVPRSVRTRAREIEHVRAELQAGLGRAPSDAELADELGIDASELRASTQPRTWVSYASTDDLAELAELEPGLDDAFEDDHLRAMLMPAVQALPERDRIVVALYFFEGLTLAEIGEVLGVTESRVSQLRSRATKSLRAAVGELG
ncbi:MAG: polymerase, sigma 28 subunit, SigD/FliA/WhiG [Nocardioides sp.]|nr:polymerase, sigma 28 subunit, SigD/FliA/WhiG [Nocardioides sp.]